MLPARPDFQELKARLHAASTAPRTGREALFPTAIADIDAVLGGGFPYGSLVTLEGCGRPEPAALPRCCSPKRPAMGWARSSTAASSIRPPWKPPASVWTDS